MGSHHPKITVLYISENVFDKGKADRTISENLHYIALFKYPRDAGQMRFFAQQVFPTKVKIFMGSFREGTKKMDLSNRSTLNRQGVRMREARLTNWLSLGPIRPC